MCWAKCSAPGCHGSDTAWFISTFKHTPIRSQSTQAERAWLGFLSVLVELCVELIFQNKKLEKQREERDRALLPDSHPLYHTLNLWLSFSADKLGREPGTHLKCSCQNFIVIYKTFPAMGRFTGYRSRVNSVSCLWASRNLWVKHLRWVKLLLMGFGFVIEVEYWTGGTRCKCQAS